MALTLRRRREANSHRTAIAADLHAIATEARDVKDRSAANSAKLDSLAADKAALAQVGPGVLRGGAVPGGG